MIRHPYKSSKKNESNTDKDYNYDQIDYNQDNEESVKINIKGSLLKDSRFYQSQLRSTNKTKFTGFVFIKSGRKSRKFIRHEVINFFKSI